MEYMEIFKANKPTEAADFFRKKLTFTLGPMDIELARKGHKTTDFVLIDVRAADDYKEGHIPGAVNLPEAEWPTLKGLSKDKLNVFYCYAQTCHLAARAALFFGEKGFPVSEMEGGWEDYKEHELEVETGEKKVA